MSELGCDLCNHTGYTLIDGVEPKMQQCICSYARTLKAHLGPEIAAAPNILRSPLYVAGPKGEPPVIDRTTDNLFLKVYWSDLLAHLKWTLACKGPMFRYRVVTDEKLKTVYVGAEAYSARPKSKRDELVTNNSVGDIIGVDFQLIIIRLGFLGHKNVAMPGVLKEALMIREASQLPTWIVEEPSSIFGPGHFSYSDDTGMYIERLFDIINLVDESRKPGEPRGVEVPEPIEDVGMEEPQIVVPRQQPEPRFEAPTMDLDDLLGNNPSGGGKYKKKSSWKKGGGGGGLFG